MDPTPKTSPIISQLEGSDETQKTRISFHVENTAPSLVNALRRTMISELPTAGFDADIKISTNTSALHNEFIQQRVSMVPLCHFAAPGSHGNYLDVVTKWNPQTATREHRFVGNHPSFHLHVKNDEETRAERKDTRPHDLDGERLWVTTLDFESGDQGTHPVEHYFCPDAHIQKNYPSEEYRAHILLNKLKVGEELTLECSPSVGTGMQNSLYSPVGTVSYGYLQEDAEKLSQVWAHRVETLKRERAEAKLEPYDEEELRSLRKSYDSLDAKRVYKCDSRGDANSIRLCIEGIGSHLPVCIFGNAIRYLEARLLDVAVCFRALPKSSLTAAQVVQAKEDNAIYPFYEVNAAKVSVEPSFTKMVATDISLKGENHTIGNVLTKTLQRLFQGEGVGAAAAEWAPLLDFVSYTKPHPLEERIVFRLKLKEHLNVQACIRELTALTEDEIDEALYEALHKEDLNIEAMPVEEAQNFLCEFLFLQGIYALVDDVRRLQDAWNIEAHGMYATSEAKNSEHLLQFHPYGLMENKTLPSVYQNKGDSRSTDVIQGVLKTMVDLVNE